MTTRSAMVAVLTMVLVTGCGKGSSPAESMTDSPASVRGWISDIQTTPKNYSVIAKPMSDSALRSDLFTRTNIYVDKAQFASGGISPDGSFILLDVPPGNVRVVFQVPGYPDCSLQLKGVPPNADVLVPSIVLRPDGAEPSDPAGVKVRLPAEKRRATSQMVTVGSARVAVVETPLDEMSDRRDYPETRAVTGSAAKPLATVK